jgi:hypothetical protein
VLKRRSNVLSGPSALSTRRTDCIAGRGVGWLSREHAFPTASAPSELVAILDDLLSSHRVRQARGFHVCEFCTTRQPHTRKSDRQQIMLGSAELWIPSPDRTIIYAAPDLVYHCIRNHGYVPPLNFMVSARNAVHATEWDANHECEERIEAAWHLEQ